MLDSPPAVFLERIRTSCCGLRNGNGRNRMVFTTLNTAMFAPIPKPRMITAQSAEGEPDILHQQIEPRQPTRLALLLLRLRHAAKANQCLGAWPLPQEARAACCLRSRAPDALPSPHPVQNHVAAFERKSVSAPLLLAARSSQVSLGRHRQHPSHHSR